MIRETQNTSFFNNNNNNTYTHIHIYLQSPSETLSNSKNLPEFSKDKTDVHNNKQVGIM